MYRTIYEKYINDLHRQLIYGVKKKHIGNQPIWKCWL